MSIKLFDLTGKTALVTGATHGLGMAISKGLGEAGARIVINDISQKKLDTAVKEYAEKGLDVAAYLFDVTDEAAVNKNLDIIEKEVAPIDILVNNAGIIKRIPIIEMQVADFEQVLKIDVTGPFIMCRKKCSTKVNCTKSSRKDY